MSASASTWSMFSTGTIRSCWRTSSGTSTRSFSLRDGMRTVFTPARCAARSFDFSPPMGRTRPRRVISPVMARSRRTGLPVRRLAMAVAIVTPALGPSFGVAPAGTWMWIVDFSKAPGSIPSSFVRARM